MQSIRRPLSFAGLSLMAMALTFAACTDDGQSPMGPPPTPPVITPRPPSQAIAIECRASVKTRDVTCGGPVSRNPGISASMLGEQRVTVELLSSNLTVVADTFAFDVQVRNVIRQPVDHRRQKLGTNDGSAPAPITVFFHSGPTVLGETGGEVRVLAEDTVNLTGGGTQPAFVYDADDDVVLDSGEITLPKRWKLNFDPQVENFTFVLLVDAAVTLPQGWVDVTTGADGPGGAVQVAVDSLWLVEGDAHPLEATTRHYTGYRMPDDTTSEPVTWSSLDPTVATVDPGTGVVTAVAPGAARIRATSTVDGGRFGDVVVTVAPAFNALENVTATVAAPGLKRNAGNTTIVAGTFPTAQGGTVTIASDGSFRYSAKGGFSGPDSFGYTIVRGGVNFPSTARVTVKPSKYWFVRADTVAGQAEGDGRQSFPFDSVANAQAVAEDNDIIVIQHADSTVKGPVLLKSGQTLIGEGIPVPVDTAMNDAVDTIVRNVGAPYVTRTDAGATVEVSTNNVLRGLGITAADGAAITGNAFVTLTASELRVAANGPALHLTNGSINAVLDSLSSTGSAAEGLFLSNVDGTLVAGGGSITDAGTVGVSITGGELSVTYPGDIDSDGQGALISGHESGALSFAGSVNAPGGVAVSGTAAGSVTFGGTITTVGGITVSGTGGAAVVAFQRKITENGQGISITGNTGGMVTFADSLVLSGKGIRIGPNGGGTIEFTGTHKSLATNANVAVSIAGDASGVRFGGGGLAITTSGARGFDVQGGGTVQVQGPNNTISTAGAEAVFIANASSGVGGITFRSVTASGAANAIVLNTLAGTGFQVTGDGATPGSGGTLSATNTAMVVSTADSVRLNRVVITAPIGVTGSSFGGLGLDSMSITATAGAALTLTTGRLHVSDVTVSATNGAALSTNDVALDGALASLTATTTTGNGVSLVSSTGSLTVPAGAISVSGAGGGTAVSVSGNTSVSFAFGGNVTQDANAALLSVAGGHAGTLAFNNGTLTANNGSGLQITDGDGVYNFNGTLDLSGGDAGIDLGAGSAGDVNVVPAGGHAAQILSPTGVAVAAAGGSADLTFNGNVTQNNAVALLDVTGNHSGTIIFAAGTVNANGGTGLQLTNADGAYNFNGTLDLSGGDAGIDIGALSTGAVNVSPAVGHTASIVSPTGAAIAIAGGSADLTFNGTVTQATAAQPLLSVAGAHSGDVSFPTGTLTATNGTGLQFNDADGSYAFGGTVNLSNSVGGADAGIDVIGGSGGTFTFSENATVTNPANQAITVQNGAAGLKFTYSGSFTKSNNAVTGILVQNSGGTVAFNGDATSLDNDPADVTKTLSTSTANAVNLLNNSGTVTFQGGGLAITTTTGTGFNATGGGTVNVTGALNAITSTGGVGVNVQNVDVGASGVFFRSVTATGTSNGIVLVNTGSTGGNFEVTGDGVAPGAVAGGGGTIQVTSGADGGVAGNGVYLQNARNVSLDWINFTGSVNHAVRGVDVVNFNMHRARVTGTHGNNAAIDESAVFFSNLSGAASITASNISGSIEDNLRFVNNTGTLNRLVLDGDTVGPHDTAEGNDGVYIESGGSAVLNATIQNSRFTSARGDWLDVNVVTTGKADLVFNGNTLTNNHPNILGGGGGMTIGAGGTSTLTYSITNSSFRDSKGTAIVLFKGFGGGAGTGVMSGTVSGNVIGVNGLANSASTEGSGIAVTELARGTHTVRIHGNQIRGYNNHGILLTAGGAATSSTGLPAHDGALNATITGNIIAQPGNLASIAAGKNGVHLNAGTNAPDAYNVCLKLGGAGAGEANSINGAGSAEVATATDFRLRNRIATTVRLPGYAGANNDNAAVTSFVQGRNPVNPTGIVSNNVAGGAPGFVGGADCTLP